MKLYFRLLWVLLTSPLRKKITIEETAITEWSVRLSDLDLYRHMNNGRYPMIMDLARLDYFIRLSSLPNLAKQQWMVPVGNTQIDFKTALKKGDKFRVETTLAYWDDTWIYFKQEFRRLYRPYPLVATGYVKAVVKGPTGIIPTQQLLAALELETTTPNLKEDIALKFQIPMDPEQKAETKGGIEPAEKTNKQAFDDSQNTVNETQNEKNRSVSQAIERGKADTNKAAEPIAVVGIGCRFPGGINNPDDLWKILLQGQDCVVDIPNSRWDPQKFYDPNTKAPGRFYVNKGGILQQDIRQFDPAFFGISPREAEVLDPMQRLLLEVSWEAFEDAGILPSTHAGSKTGVFVGGFITDNMIRQSSAHNRHRLSSHSAVSSTLTMLSNRLSYFYDFKGPSFSLDTACSSSLVAIHQACESIRRGESTSALAGGVNMLLVPETHVTMAKGQFLSPNGRCNAFGAGADGYVRGEGAALVLLKPLSEALAAGDDIYSVIQGSAVNQDGYTNGITVPNGQAQIDAMTTACERANVEPSQINYVEAHGTGTPVGDPIEAGALGAVLSRGRNANQPCPIGSLKTNLGHMEAAAGIGGLIKASLILKHRALVPHLHLDKVNPNIDLENLKLRIPNSVEPLPKSVTLYAGVNSFGYGGTNAHAILSSPPAPIEKQTSETSSSKKHVERCFSLPISAASDESLSLVAQTLLEDAKHLEVPFRDWCTAVATQRSTLSHRAWIQGKSMDEIKTGLQEISAGSRRGTGVQSAANLNSKVMFVFTGMGPQWWGMGRGLYDEEPVFRESVDECDAIFKTVSGWSIRDEMLSNQDESRITQTHIAQPANFVFQFALTKLLASWGVTPSGIVGHSIGEVGAAWASGGLSLQQALTVAYHRSRLQALTAGKGSMLAVGLSQEKAEQLLPDLADLVSIAAINSPNSVTLAGDTTALEKLASHLESERVFNKFLKVEVPYHSPVMDEILDQLRDSLTPIQTSDIHTPLYSTVMQGLMEGAHDANYWCRNVREPVRFAATIDRAIDDGYDTFFEIGPHPVLTSSMLEVAKTKGKRISCSPTLIREQNETLSINQTLGAWYCAGKSIDTIAYFGETKRTRLPLYPWNRKEYWSESTLAKQHRLPLDVHPMVTETRQEPTNSWVIDLNTSSLPYLKDHIVSDQVLFPGAAYAELGIALSLAKSNSSTSATCIDDLEFLAPVTVAADKLSRLYLQENDQKTGFQAYMISPEDEPTLCARAQFYSTPFETKFWDVANLEERFEQQLEKPELYAVLLRRGLNYGPQFQAVESLRIADKKVLAYITLPQAIDPTGYQLHPVLLDAALHSLIASDIANNTTSQVNDDSNIIPLGIKRFRWFGSPVTSCIAYGRITYQDESNIIGDITLMTDAGKCIGEVTGLRCRILPKPQEETFTKVANWCYERRWSPLEQSTIDELPKVDIDWIILSSPEHNHPDLDLNESPGSLAFGKLQFIEQLDDDKEAAQKTLSLAIEKAASHGRRAGILDLRFLKEASPLSEATLEQEASRAFDLVTTIQSIRENTLFKYALITCDSEKVNKEDQRNPDRAMVLGIARTAMSERPDLKFTYIDADRTNPKLEDLLFKLVANDANQELALRNDALFCAQLERAEIKPPRMQQNNIKGSDATAYIAHQAKTGHLNAFHFKEIKREAPQANQVEVKVDTCSLHFKDLMKAKGMLSQDALSNTYYGDQMGMEGTGVITAVGTNVRNFKIGDRVYGRGEFLRSHNILSDQHIVKIPDNLSLEECANLITYLTVYHSLVTVAKLQAGEKVLIHSAAGGVGLAAIHIANWIGAEVFATASTEEKREYLKTLNVAEIGDSRSLQFVAEIDQWTNGKGVDVVLNFTPGQIADLSLGCLAPFGRFVELGKMNFENNEAMRLKPFNENLSYMAVDFDRLIKAQPIYTRELVVTILELISTHKIPPLPCRSYPAGQLSEALKDMSLSKHIGKFAIKLEDDTLEVEALSTEQMFSSDASYLVTGGLSGFGLSTAMWMADNGAKHLILVSRSGMKSKGAEDIVAELNQRNVEVEIVAADVSNIEQMSTIINTIETPLKGVVHAAMILEDQMLQELETEKWHKVIRAKALGAFNLHQLTKDMELDFMVFYSSISALIGNAGQANYVAANSYLDMLAQVRQSMGLSTLSINWGVFGETGVVARNDKLSKHLEHIGIHPFSTSEATEALGLLLQQNHAQLGLFDVNWGRFVELLPEGSGKARYQKLYDASGNHDQNSTVNPVMIKLFSSQSDEQRLSLIENAMVMAVANVMRLDAKDVDKNQSLRDLGLDSLMAVEIDLEFSTETGLELSVVDLSSSGSIKDLCLRLREGLNEKLPIETSAEEHQEVEHK